MALERKWLAVSAKPLTANGTSIGVVTVQDTGGFRVKQLAFLVSNAFPGHASQFQVNAILSPTQLVLGPRGPKVGREVFSDLSAFLVVDGAVIAAPEQDKSQIPDKDHYLAVYEAEPIVADRVIWVDQYGRFYGPDNPLPIAFDGTIAIGDVKIRDNDGDTLEVNPDGSINVNIVTAQTGNKVKNVYNEAHAVPAGVETTIVQYMVPLIITNAILQRISVSGENVGRFQIFINGVLVDTRRTYYGANFSEYFEFSVNTTDGFTLAPGDVVAVKILHNKPQVGDFEGRIQVFEIA